MLTPEGWLVVYHGVSRVHDPDVPEERLSYAAGLTILSEHNPQEILYRTSQPILKPVPTPGPRGTTADVVFPTGIDRRDDIGRPARFDVNYGINEFRIGVARLELGVNNFAMPASQQQEDEPSPIAL